MSGFIENYIGTTEDVTGWMWGHVNSQQRMQWAQLLGTPNSDRNLKEEMQTIFPEEILHVDRIYTLFLIHCKKMNIQNCKRKMQVKWLLTSQNS